MWTFPFRRHRGSVGAPPSPDGRSPSLRAKIIISAFILFHFGCVAVWVFPAVPSPTVQKDGNTVPGLYSIRKFLLSLSVPLPARRLDPATNSLQWRIERLSLIGSYLGRTGQWQHWNLFAPNPMTFNRYLAGRVTYRAGNWREVTLPRVEQLDVVRAHLEARYREYQYGLTGPLAPVEDLARFIARSLNDPANPAVRVTLYACKLEIPAHDRSGLHGPDAPRTVDYSKLLRDPTLTERRVLLEYAVNPGDLQ
jgi:hypothetical protein